MRSALRQGRPGPLEYSGCFLAVTVHSSDFSSFEIWNFIEQILQTTVEDLSLFRHYNGMPTGVVVAQLADDVPLSRLDRFHGREFKGFPAEARLFDTMQAFQKFMRLHAELRDEPVSALLRVTIPPVVYILNFEGTDEDLKALFGQCGEITLAMSAPFRERRYHTLCFATDEAARKAARTFNGHAAGSAPLVVAALNARSATLTLAIRRLASYALVADELEGFGSVKEVKAPGDGSVYVMMAQLDAAKAACALLNQRVFGGERVTTHFVDAEFFERIAG
jgi:hypothetical protein